MSSPFPPIRQLPRDGTSQRARRPDALDPASAPLDERTLAELLVYVRDLGKLLRWYDEEDRPAGTWDRLLGAAGDAPERLAAYAADPARLPAELTASLALPHVTLLLAVLRLMERARQRLNELPARHIEFYQREILQLRPRPAQPDRVHVLVTPAAGRHLARLPQGSLLAAGQDPGGRERLYATEHELGVSRARVAALRSLFTEVLITDPPAVRRDHNRTPGERFMDLLRLALGEPGPGDPLPPRGGWPAVDEAFVTETLAAWIDFARSDAPPATGEHPKAENLYLDLFELRELVRYKRERDDDAADWALINGVLNAIGARRTGAAFDLRARLGDAFDPRNFTANLAEALGQAPDLSGLEDVVTIDDLYERRDRDEVRRFLRDTPPYEALLDPDSTIDPPALADDFIAMMQRKRTIDAHWAAIVAYLELAGRRLRGDPGFVLSDVDGFDPTDYASNLARALPELDFDKLPAIGRRGPVQSITAYMSILEEIEAYFFMPAEALQFLIRKALPALSSDQDDRPIWQQADAILAKARAAKAIVQRRAALGALRRAQGSAEQALTVLLTAALGLPADERPSLAMLVGDAGGWLAAEQDRVNLQTHANTIDERSPTDEEWQALEAIAELAQRARLGPEAASIGRREWINLYAYADATQVVSPPPTGESPVQGPPTKRRWRTFGAAPTHQDPDIAPDAILGWAMTAPVLAMRQGVRRIELTLQFDATALTADELEAIRGLMPGADEAAGEGPFIVEVSSTDGWLGADAESLSLTLEEPKLTLALTLSFSASAPPIEAPPPELGIASRWPVLRLMLRPRWDGALERFRSPYPVLRVLRLAALECSVTVGDPDGVDPEAGLIEPLLRNDQGLLDAGKPFEPFSHRPAVGSRLAIADPELAVKRLDTLWLDLAWLGVPERDLHKWYAGYSRHAEISNAAFKVQVSMLDRRSATPVGGPVPLFDGKDAIKAHRIMLTEVDAALGDPPPAPPALPPSPPKDPTRWPRHLRLELTPLDFQHPVFPGEVARAASANPPKPLNPPYTPQLKAIGIGYRARSSWQPALPETADDGEALFHLHPFGTGRPVGDGRTVGFLPRYDDAGALYIGLAEVSAPQRLTLLLQLAEGTADPDLTPTPVRWSCLDGDRWVDLDRGELRRDETRSLINSGIVELDLPAVRPATLLPGGLYWLALAVAAHPRSVCDTVAIAANAVAAVCVARDNDPAHYAEPLPAGSIKAPARPIPGIGRIEQPYTSFDGRPAESAAALSVRAAERLRHRRRALTAWDYERLALERFPQLYKVKCIPASASAEGLRDVQVIVIPHISRQRLADPHAPKAPASLLAGIAAYLEERAAPDARVEVRNADFVQIKVRVGIRFNADFDVGLARAELIAALNRLLSPWAFDDGADIVIGGAVYASSIIDFLERQPSVDYVQELRLFRFDAAAGRFEAVPPPAEAETGGYHVAAQAPDQVLTAAYTHEIDEIRLGVETDELFTGIGYMKVGLDFVVA